MNLYQEQTQFSHQTIYFKTYVLMECMHQNNITIDNLKLSGANN